MVWLSGLGSSGSRFLLGRVFPLTVTGGKSRWRAIFQHRPFLSEKPDFQAHLFVTQNLCTCNLLTAFQFFLLVGSETMPPRKAIDWTNDDDLIRRLENSWEGFIGLEEFQEDFSRPKVFPRIFSLILFGFIMIYHPNLDLLVKDGK